MPAVARRLQALSTPMALRQYATNCPATPTSQTSVYAPPQQQNPTTNTSPRFNNPFTGTLISPNTTPSLSTPFPTPKKRTMSPVAREFVPRKNSAQLRMEKQGSSISTPPQQPNPRPGTPPAFNDPFTGTYVRQMTTPETLSPFPAPTRRLSPFAHPFAPRKDSGALGAVTEETESLETGSDRSSSISPVTASLIREHGVRYVLMARRGLQGGGKQVRRE